MLSFHSHCCKQSAASRAANPDTPKTPIPISKKKIITWPLKSPATVPKQSLVKKEGRAELPLARRGEEGGSGEREGKVYSREMALSTASCGGSSWPPGPAGLAQHRTNKEAEARRRAASSRASEAARGRGRREGAGSGRSARALHAIIL